MDNRNVKRTVGKKQEQAIVFDASAELLLKGIKFNEEIHKIFQTKDNGTPKGLYHFKSHKEANRHQEECIANKMARRVLEAEDGLDMVKKKFSK